MVDAAPEFFGWLQANVTDDMILTREEVKEYEELKKAGKLLPESELEQRLKEIETENPGLSECKEQDLKVSKKKLKRLRKIKKRQEKMMAELDVAEKAQESKLAKSKLYLSDIEKETELLVEKTNQVAKELQDVEEENRQLYQDLQASVKTPNTFTHQMPFHEHHNFMEQFIKQLEEYCAHNQIYATASVVKENHDAKLGELQVAKDGLVKARYQEIMHEMKVAAQEAVSTAINSGSVQLPADMNQLMSMMNKYSAVNDEKANHLTTLKDGLLKRISEMVLCQIEVLSTKNIKFKHERATDRLENINQLKPFVDKMIQISEIIWFVLNLDCNRLNKDFSCDDFGAKYAMHMRIKVMKRLLQGDSVPLYLKTVQDQVIKTITDAIGMEGGNLDVKEVIQAYSQFETDLSAAVACVSEGVASIAVSKHLQELKVIEKVLEKFVYGGTTSKPQLSDPRFTKKIMKICAEKKDIQQKYTEMKTICKENEDCLVSSWNKSLILKSYSITSLYFQAQDKYYRYSQVLWIWFLTEPVKVLQAIKEVTKEALKGSPIHLSGIRRQN